MAVVKVGDRVTVTGLSEKSGTVIGLGKYGDGRPLYLVKIDGDGVKSHEADELVLEWSK